MEETPLFAFGHGLSYSDYKYGKDTSDRKELKLGQTLTLTIPVTNKSNVDGEEVVQIYLKHSYDKEGPKKALRAYKRVNIAKGETHNVVIELPSESCERVDVFSNTMHPLTGI